MRSLLATLAMTVLVSCSMTQGETGGTGQPEPKRVEKSETPPEKTAATAPRPERRMTEKGKSAIDRLADSQASDVVRIEAARQLAELADPATVVPMVVVMEGELSDALEDEIHKALDLMGATEILVGDLTAGDDATRATAADLLPRLKDPAAVPPLMQALSDPVAKVRESAAGALGVFKAPQAEGPLTERLQKDPDPDVRGAAAQSLGALHTPGAQAALERALAAEKDDFVKVLIEKSLAP